MEETKKIDDLALHETTFLSDKESVMRVPGGFIYCFYEIDYRYANEPFKLVKKTVTSSVFVPEIK